MMIEKSLVPLANFSIITTSMPSSFASASAPFVMPAGNGSSRCANAMRFTPIAFSALTLG